MKTIKKSVAILLSILMLFSVMAVGVTASADETTTVYFVNTNGWEQVAAYVWGGANGEIAGTWPGTVVTEVDGVYSYDIQDSTHVIFNNNGNGSQTSNLEAGNAIGKYYEPKTAKFYDTAQEALDAANGPIEKTYTVAGTPELCGTEWNPADTNNDMTAGENGIYTKVYTDVPAGTHRFKVTENHSWDVSYGDPNGPEGNFEIIINSSATVTITFDAATCFVSHTIEDDTAPEPIEATDGTAYFVNTYGWEAVAAHVWNANNAAENNNGWPGELAKVEDDANGVYSFAFTDKTHIIFNNNVAENGSKTANLDAAAAVNKYYEPKTAKFYDTAQDAIDAANVPVVKTYTVAGTAGLCGNEWDPADTNNDMIGDENGVYTKVYTDVPAGTHRFKIAENHGWEVSYGDPNGPEGNFEFTVNDKATVTITFDDATDFVAYTIDGDTPSSDPTGSTPAGPKTYTIVGYINGADVGCNNDWETVVEAYNFVDGKATITFEQDSYVFVKTTDNANWYMTQAACTETSATFFNTNTGAGEKMFVPAGKVDFTLVENADGSLNISYAPAEEQPTETEPQPTETQPATKAPTLNAKSKNLNAGQTFKVKVNNANGKKVTYTSKNAKVATVSKTGVVTALTKGSAKINVKVGTKTLTCTINVKTDPKLQKNTITVNKGKKTTVKVIGAAANPKVSKCTVAKVTPSKTKLTIKANNKKGSQKITVTVNGKKLKLTVKVK